MRYNNNTKNICTKKEKIITSMLHGNSELFNETNRTEQQQECFTGEEINLA